tara:strand:- start:401 stop:1015 length:615 start_codon:yes stop_codon:yes gene_type:complete
MGSESISWNSLDEDLESWNTLNHKDFDACKQAMSLEQVAADTQEPCIHDFRDMSEAQKEQFQKDIARSETMSANKNNQNQTTVWSLIRRETLTDQDGNVYKGKVTHILAPVAVEGSDNPDEWYVKVEWQGTLDGPKKVLLVAGVDKSWTESTARAVVKRCIDDGELPINEFVRVRIGARPFSCFDPLTSPVTREFELNPRNHMV